MRVPTPTSATWQSEPVPVTQQLGGARRILLHGVTGAGKTTLGLALAERLGLPFVDMDHLSWRPGWTEVPPEQLAATVEDLAAGEEWVFDTAYSRVRPTVLARAQVVVALDYPLRVVRWRLLRRTARRVLTRERVCHGNVETLSAHARTGLDPALAAVGPPPQARGDPGHVRGERGSAGPGAAPPARGGAAAR